MPEISPFGWFHTIIAIVAMVCGLYTLFRYKVIATEQLTGKIYIIGTALAALSALAIYRHGGFGVAHGLAVLTLLALLVGFGCEKRKLLGKFSPYIQALAYSATYLFHMIPAITDGLMRLPVDNPIVTDIKDPLLKQFYLSFLIAYLIVAGLQMMFLSKKKPAEHEPKFD